MDEKKVAELKAKLQEQPENEALWFELGQEYFEYEWQDAINCFSRCISINPFCSDYYFNRGRKKLSQDKFEMALADFVTALRMDTETGMKWHYAGVACFYLGMYEEALEYFKRSIETNIKYDGDLIPPSVDWSWMAYMKLGRPDDALKILDYVNEDTKIAETDRDYKKRVLLYQGKKDPEEFYSEVDRKDDLLGMAEVYGLSNYYYYIKKDAKRSLALLEETLAYENWHHAFAYKSALREIEGRRAEVQGN